MMKKRGETMEKPRGEMKGESSVCECVCVDVLCVYVHRHEGEMRHTSVGIVCVSVCCVVCVMSPASPVTTPTPIQYTPYTRTHVLDMHRVFEQ
jgi:hypothetical protein